MSSSFKSRIPERVRHSLTALDGPHSREVAPPNRCSLNRSQLPLPISKTLNALVKQTQTQTPAKVVCKKPEPEAETEAVIRSLVRRSRPPAVRGNRTSFRRIQLAHGSPVASASLLMKPTSSYSNANSRLQKPIKVASPVAPKKEVNGDHTTDNLPSAKGLLELVAGKWQPDMEQMRFLCSDHRLINVPSPLMYCHSEVMRQLEVEKQPIELRSIRSVTLLRVIMWMHQKTLSSNGTENSAVAPPTVEELSLCANPEGNGSTKSENSCQLSENPQDNSQSMVNSICQIHGEKIKHSCMKTLNNSGGVKNQIGNDYTTLRNEVNENSRESNENTNQSNESLDKNSGNTCTQTSDTKKSFENNEQSQENYKVECATDTICNGYKRCENEKTENCTIPNDNVENGEKEIINKGIIQLNPKSENTENKNRHSLKKSDKKDANLNGSSQDYSVISEQNIKIGNENSTGIETCEEGRSIEGESSYLGSADENLFSEQAMQNFDGVKESNENRRCIGDNGNDKGDQCVNNLNGMKHSSFLLCSWEERLLGSELYQLVELILAAHYLGIESLTLNAIQHFDELMAQRTRSECCLMLRIKTRLAGERQLENHRPLTRGDTLSQGRRDRNYQADRAETRKHHFDPNNRIARMARQHRSNGRPAGGGGGGSGGGVGGGMGGRLNAIDMPRHRHHQYCFQSRI
ncbi:uncharacterized protein LOC6524536 [Drosophila yakuba]|uniref:Uncharacterized protein n=1 Tax=Drosophila yakuba TaxID=7245 RepID=B4Q1Y0_DROYA|nr:uncharacterized protein LOC6524536 [Drosophila yakuba]EDX01501.2 uncharacterized protein Dyak_GE16194 [Drosophila yakuba]